MIRKIATTALTALLAGATLAQVDLNTATEIELDGIKGLGPSTTQHIMDERRKAAFRDWPDVMRRIQGIGPKKAAQLSEQGVQVRGQSYGQAPKIPPPKP